MYVVYPPSARENDRPLYVGVAGAQTIAKRWRQHLTNRAGGSALRRSLDPRFGFSGWESLTNPDVYLHEGGPEATYKFMRVWA